MTRTCLLPRALLLALLIALALSVRPGRANPGPIAEIICAPSAQITERLQTHLRASRSWQGMRSPDEVMELWENPRGDWTLIIARASGISCIVAMGGELSGFSDLPQG